MGVAPSLSSGPSREADVAGFHVRSTPWPNGKLIVRPGDPEDNVYVLVVGSGKEWRVIGTAVGHEAIRPEFWYDENRRPGCYMLPQDRLRRMQVQPGTSRPEQNPAVDRTTVPVAQGSTLLGVARAAEHFRSLCTRSDSMSGPEDRDDADPEGMDDREYDELDLAPEEGYEALSEMDDWDEDGAERED